MLPNQQAFLAMIAHSEGTDRAPDPYRVCYGYQHTIQDLRDHPAITGEWKGESIANLGPQYAGEVSTAAGKYQINRPTWIQCKAALNLRDFTGPSQDDAALYLIKKAGALDILNGGQVAAAITLCHGLWASLPGGNSGQPERSFADLIQAYGDAGGAFA